MTTFRPGHLGRYCYVEYKGAGRDLVVYDIPMSHALR